MSNRPLSLLALAALSFAPALAAAATSPFPPPTTIYDSIGGAENGGDTFSSAGFILLDRVLNPTEAYLRSVTLNMKAGANTDGSFRVVICPQSPGGKPFHCANISIVAYAALTHVFSPITVAPTTKILLAANTPYFVGIQFDTAARGARTSVHLGNTLTPSVLARPSVAAGATYYNNGGLQANSGGPYEITVTTIATTPAIAPAQ